MGGEAPGIDVSYARVGKKNFKGLLELLLLLVVVTLFC